MQVGQMNTFITIANNKYTLLLLPNSKGVKKIHKSKMKKVPLLTYLPATIF